MPRPDRERLREPTSSSDAFWRVPRGLGGTLGDAWSWGDISGTLGDVLHRVARLGGRATEVGLAGARMYAEPTLWSSLLREDPSRIKSKEEMFPFEPAHPAAISRGLRSGLEELFQGEGVDIDAAIAAFDEAAPTGWGHRGAAELVGSLIPTGAPFVAGGKLISSAPKLAQTLSRVAPASSRARIAERVIQPTLEKTGQVLRVPWQAEEAAGRLIARGIGAAARPLVSRFRHPVEEAVEGVVEDVGWIPQEKPLPSMINWPKGMVELTDELMPPTRRSVNITDDMLGQPPVAVRRAPATKAETADMLPGLQDIDEAITISQRKDVGRFLANLPFFRQIQGKLNPSAVANRPELRGLVGREILLVEAQQKTQTVMARLRAIGSFDEVFGKVDETTNLVSVGRLSGAAPNDIRTYPDNIVINGRKVELNQTQRNWVNTAKEIEEQKLRYLKKNGIKVKELSFDQGGSYAGRRVYGKFDPKTNEIVSYVSFDNTRKPGIMGSELSFQKARPYKTQKEAIDDGYRYLSEETTLALNVQRAYDKVANDQFLNWMKKEIPSRLPKGVDEGMILRRAKKGESADLEASRKVFEYIGPDSAKRTKQAVDALKASLDPQLSRALGMVNQANAVGRFFSLSGDMSPGGIQLLTMVFTHPVKYGKAMGGFVQALFDPKFHDRYMAKNADVINRHRGMLTSLQGNEMTEAFARGGWIQKKWNPKVWGTMTETLGMGRRAFDPVKYPRMVLTPFQRGFNASMDVAGVELAKGLENIAKTKGVFDSVKLHDLDSYINEVRGLASSQRLGVTGKVRQWETALMLAPRYNRAIAALLWDAIQGTVRTVPGMGEQTIRTKMARDALVWTMGGFSALNAGITLALYASQRGWDLDEMDGIEAGKEALKHLTPWDPEFFTWNIGGRNIGPGTKIRSVIKLLAQSAADPSALNPFNTEGGLYRAAMNNPAIKFLRGSAAPIVSTATDILTGYTYIGEPTRDDLGDLEGWTGFLKNVVAPDLMPIYMQALLLEGGPLSSRILGAGVEFFGGRGYPLTREQLAQEKHKEDPKHRDIPWESLPGDVKLMYEREVDEDEGGPQRWGPAGKIEEAMDKVTESYSGALEKIENMLGYAPFATGHFGDDGRKALQKLERDMYDELNPLMEELWPGPREEPEKDTREWHLWRYHKIYEESVLQEDKIDPLTGNVESGAGEIDWVEANKQLDELWESIDREAAELLLTDIHLREREYPPDAQLMKSAIRWLGTITVDLNGVPTKYWDIGEHPDVKRVLAMSVPELSISEIEAWMESTSSARRSIESRDERYAKLGKVRSGMYSGTGVREGLIKRFKKEFAREAPEGWLYTMSMYYQSLYRWDKVVGNMKELHEDGVPLPDLTTEWYRDQYRDYVLSRSS